MAYSLYLHLTYLHWGIFFNDISLKDLSTANLIIHLNEISFGISKKSKDDLAFIQKWKYWSVILIVFPEVFWYGSLYGFLPGW